MAGFDPSIEAAAVRVVRRYFRMVSKLSSGRPAQFLLISQNRRCSMGFHFDAAVG